MALNLKGPSRVAVEKFRVDGRPCGDLGASRLKVNALVGAGGR